MTMEVILDLKEDDYFQVIGFEEIKSIKLHIEREK